MPSKARHNPADTAARSAAVTELLKKHFPTYRTQTGVLDIRGLALDMGLSHETIYRVVRQVTEIKRQAARRIVMFSRENPDAEPLHYRDLIPFMFHDWNEVESETETGNPGVGDLLS